MKENWASYMRSWRSYPIMQITTLSVLTATYCVVTLFLSLYLNFDRILSQWGDSVNISAYLQDDMSKDQISRLQDSIEKMTDVKRVSLISKKEAIEKFKGQMNSYAPNLLDDPSFAAALPASFEIDLKRSMKAPEQYSKLVSLADEVSKMAGVEDVSYGHGWVENYASVVKAFSATSGFLVLVLLAASLFVVGNSIRNSIAQRREEIEILELVGATRNMIRKPYIFEGFMMGFLASSISLLLGYSIYLGQSYAVSSDFTLWGVRTAFSYLDFWGAAAVLICGTSFGTLGSYFSVRRMSTGWSAVQRLETWNKR